MPTGKIKFYLEEKGFGFVVDDESGQDFFFHKSATDTPLRENDAVTYEVEEGRKGLEATKVRKAD